MARPLSDRRALSWLAIALSIYVLALAAPSPAGLAVQMAILCVTFLVVAVVVDSGWAVAAGRARQLLVTRMRLANRISGGLLITAAVGLAVARNK